MTLFEIDQEIANCVKLTGSDDYVNVETGEIIDLDALNELKVERDKKIRNIACWVKNLESDARELAEQIKIFGDRKRAVESKKESLKNYLAAFLNGQKWENKEVKISWRASESVEITTKNVNDLPEEYLKFKAPEPDKTALKTALKDGKVIEGVTLVKKNNIQIK